MCVCVCCVLTIADGSEGEDILHMVNIKHFDQSHIQHGSLHQHPHEGHQPEVMEKDCHC